MQTLIIQWILRYSSVLVRLALGIVFLSMVADRLGLWGPPGTPNVSWGNFENFINSVRDLNPYLPEILVPVVSWGVTVAELVFGLLLLIGYKTQWVALLSGFLCLTFVISTGIAFGIKAPLSFSVVVDVACAFLLASQGRYPLSVDQWLKNRKHGFR
jgi:uncharacterized membrane protein YphA (DoxX/SURF4 family)